MRVQVNNEGSRSVWRGYLSFGLISVPVRLFVAARHSHIAFYEVHRTCGTRLHHQFYCPYDERVLSRDEITLAYELDKRKCVLVERAELKKIQPWSSSTAEIIQFVKISEIDPVYFESSYLLIPEEAGRKAYALLVKTMQGIGTGALAKITLHQSERAALVRPYENGLMLHTLYFRDEIHIGGEFGQLSANKLGREEVRLGEQLARGLMKPFRSDEFRDEYRIQVKQLIEKKQKGNAVPKKRTGRKLAPVVDLMSALKKSLAKSSEPAGRGKAMGLKKTA
jgi:DNA end-binding protein Ku